MGARLAAVAALAALAIFAGASTARAGEGTLDLSVERGAAVGQPLEITASGLAAPSQLLFLYVEPGSYCAGTPQKQASEVAGSVELSAGGLLIPAGSFERTFRYTPPAEHLYSLCGYLDDRAQDAPGAYDGVGFEVPEGRVPAPPISEAESEELQRLALEDAQAEELRHEREREEREREGLPRLTYEPPQPEPPPTSSSPAPRVATVHCVVPSVRGHSLDGARRLLRDAHCGLGTVRRRTVRGALVVIEQRERRGAVLPEGARVSILLGAARRR